jgi:hypothetical protein
VVPERGQGLGRPGQRPLVGRGVRHREEGRDPLTRLAELGRHLRASRARRQVEAGLGRAAGSGHPGQVGEDEASPGLAPAALADRLIALGQLVEGPLDLPPVGPGRDAEQPLDLPPLEPEVEAELDDRPLGLGQPLDQLADRGPGEPLDPPLLDVLARIGRVQDGLVERCGVPVVGPSPGLEAVADRRLDQSGPHLGRAHRRGVERSVALLLEVGEVGVVVGGLAVGRVEPRALARQGQQHRVSVLLVGRPVSA